MQHLRSNLVCGWFALVVLSTAAQGQEKKPAGKGIDADTVTAYEKLGAKYGGFVTLRGGDPRFQAGRENAEKGVPTFHFERFPKQKLPEVAVPFGLDLNFSDVTDAGLKELARLKNLSALDLRGTQVTDAGLKELAGLNNLSWLYLGGTNVTDVGLKELAGLNNLSVLVLSGTKVTGAGLKELAGLKNLSALDLDQTQVTDAVLRSLREIGLLHALTSATGKDGARPRSAEEVVSLYLYNSQVTDVGLKELAQLKNLSYLDLNFTRVTDVGLRELAGLKNLSTLGLYDTKVTAVGVAELGKALPKCKISR